MVQALVKSYREATRASELLGKARRIARLVGRLEGVGHPNSGRDT